MSSGFCRRLVGRVGRPSTRTSPPSWTRPCPSPRPVIAPARTCDASAAGLGFLAAAPIGLHLDQLLSDYGALRVADVALMCPSVEIYGVGPYSDAIVSAGHPALRLRTAVWSMLANGRSVCNYVYIGLYHFSCF